MKWLVLLAVSFILIFLGKRFRWVDDVSIVAIYSLGLLSFLWGFFLAPTPAQVTLEMATIGWLRFRSHQG